MVGVGEYTSVCCWVEDQKVFDLIREKFKVVEEVVLDYDPSMKLELLRNLYHPHHIGNKDARVTIDSKITIFVIQLINPKIEIISRREHTDVPMYTDLVSFKGYARSQITTTLQPWQTLHTPDWLNESNYFFETVGLTKYINNAKYVKLADLRGIVFHTRVDWANQCIQKLDETPHFGYIKGDKSPYEKYIREIATGRSLEKFDNLIKTIPTDFGNIPPIQLCRGLAGTELKIYDGLHRSCMLLSMGHVYIKAVDAPEHMCNRMNGVN